MAIKTVEVRIQGYSDGQLSRVTEILDGQALKLTSGITTGDNLSAQLRVVSMLLGTTGGSGFVSEEATVKDFLIVDSVRKDFGRLDVLFSLRGKLVNELRIRGLDGPIIPEIFRIR